MNNHRSHRPRGMSSEEIRKSIVECCGLDKFFQIELKKADSMLSGVTVRNLAAYDALKIIESIATADADVTVSIRQMEKPAEDE